MGGKIKQMIDTIVAQRSKGNPAIAKAVKAKLILKGINPDGYTAGSADDPAVLRLLDNMARELGVSI